MIELFESIMLICFGISWPLSVIRNYRARTARNMSLGFTLLIIIGYLFGIAAKIQAGTFSYVLIIYIFNLAAVTANLVIYFINRSIDMRNAVGASACDNHA